MSLPVKLFTKVTDHRLTTTWALDASLFKEDGEGGKWKVYPVDSCLCHFKKCFGVSTMLQIYAIVSNGWPRTTRRSVI